VPPSRGDFIEAGVTTAVARGARLDATVFHRAFTNFADDDVFLNTGISFPIAFNRAVVRGADFKLTLRRWGPLSGFMSYSYLQGRADLPATGGLFLGGEAADALVEDRVPISQDQRHTLRARMRHQANSRIWSAAAIRLGSGLPVELDDDVDAEQLVAHYGAQIVDRVDFDRGRIAANLAIDGIAGIEAWRGGRRRLEIRVEVLNVTNALNVVNFAGLFSGTAIAPARSVGVRARLEF
jgi:hypothetical protein